MKKLIFILAFFSCAVILQAQWSKYVLTSGYADKNPVFASKFFSANMYFYQGWEFLAFERHSGGYSQIMLARLGLNGFEAAPVQVTDNNSLKQNPAIGSCFTGSYMSGVTIVSSLVIWEDNRNGRWDLYASVYTPTAGWGSPFPFDSSAVSKSSPKVIGRDSVIYYVVYEKSGDIIYREFNSRTKSVLSDTNLTAGVTELCGNPYIVNGFNSPLTRYVSYERMKPDTSKAVYYKVKSTGGWSEGDTAAYLGNNINTGFGANWSSLGVEGIFSSNRTGKYLLYHTKIAPAGSPSQSTVLMYHQPNINYFKYKNFFYPIITEYIYSQIHSFVAIGDSTKLIFAVSTYGIPDTVTLGSSTTGNSYSLNNGIFYNYNLNAAWIVFSKDSLGYVNLYGRRALFSLGGVSMIGSERPDNFSLYQNYPNPFNQFSIIKFQVPGSEFVKLAVYDISGREVKTLVNDVVQAGTYQVSFNGEGLASGIYFYRMETNGFSKTNKLILLK